MSFAATLQAHRLTLNRATTSMLQVNLGPLCDLACRHCHLEAGPARSSESMRAETAALVLACARRFPFASIDLTGGAPELWPLLPPTVAELAKLTPRLVVRTNLVALARPAAAPLLELYCRHRVVLVASLPALNAGQTDGQRGSGVWDASLAMLRRLNALGYGQPDSGLELDLAANPNGAFLPPGQAQAEQRFRQELARRHAIVFNRLFTFANVPLGRFRAWLEHSGNLTAYQMRLEERFNPATVGGLMCRSQLSVNWDGTLYDCDFHLAAGLPPPTGAHHIRDLHQLPAPGTPIALAEHCFACTAGAGFTCGGSIAAEETG